ncbi:lytic transglycosylase domain-containing protein [Cyanobium sp. T1B-Tous]|uniref:lytic transglycosylase domain-containing protein n=1 Tax=Cyanobium sp. T1B-Tous TaxID=2823721 RepID=UPI0020CE98C5|nr:lytic transglycosylase domain-containing protein [Cyanobium sp. T1B-Tous]
MARLPLLLALTCLCSGAGLVAGGALLAWIPAADPQTSTSTLQRLAVLSPDPERRREARLLLVQRQGDDPASERVLLRGQGWGPDSLAALVLKRDALAAEALGDPATAQRRWQLLLRRFPQTPAAADGLYALGRQRPELRQQLLKRFAAHPAALAAALEAGPAPSVRLEGALHLARHGVRWPGAELRLRQACQNRTAVPSPAQRDQLAAGLAQLGNGDAALACLQGQQPDLDTQLALAKALLAGGDAQQSQARERLLQLARSAPRSPQASEAVALLSDQPGASTLQALSSLPPSLQATAPVQARRALESSGTGAVLAVLQRWPSDPASWELQWQRSRQALLAGQWATAETLLLAPIGQELPPALAGRQRFWLGFSQWQQGQRTAARRTWSALLSQQPEGYYGWRAAVRLGQGDLSLDHEPSSALAAPGWQPLESGNGELDRLWRLDQPLEAWEHWRTARTQPASTPQELVLEGRLRRGVGDHWIGLGQLEQASLRLTPQRSGLPPGPHCTLARQLARSLQTPAFVAELNQAATTTGIPATLLAAVAKQESRFSPGVSSPAGAVGLLQLMPETAAELASGPLQPGALTDPSRNAQLGALYLAQLLRQWQGNPVLMAASYNAGPGAVAGWVSPQLQQDPELWIEAIPYPETRLYVKKVLGNLWNFQQQPRPAC